MMELYVSSRSKLRSSYNVKYGDTNVSISIFVWPPEQLSHSAKVDSFRTLEDRVMRICD